MWMINSIKYFLLNLDRMISDCPEIEQGKWQAMPCHEPELGNFLMKLEHQYEYARR